jgi:7,8-dihydropterin-6-yl-methyl-4-(beta-D-ribofuranosyl)aminobenzene 5'-phosphate synthase
MIGAAPIPEISMILDSGQGVTLLTGCAHPGIVEIAQKASDLRGKPVGCVLGGFHLMSTPEAKVKEIIYKLKGLGAVSCGATHCTGDAAIAMFKKEFGEAFIPMGVGRKFAL